MVLIMTLSGIYRQNGKVSPKGAHLMSYGDGYPLPHVTIPRGTALLHRSSLFLQWGLAAAWLLEPGYWSLDTGTLDTGTLDTGTWILEPWILEPGYWSLDTGAWILEYGACCKGQ